MTRSDFHSPFSHDFVRIGVCTPAVRPADPGHNADQTLDLAHAADARGATVLVFPELGISAYAIDDLHHQAVLLADVQTALAKLAEGSRALRTAIVVGAPLMRRGRLYNCAVVIHAGRLVGVVPKSYLPNYREFYEPRWFTPGHDTTGEIEIAGAAVPFGADLMFRSGGEGGDGLDVTFHVEICEDVWAPTRPRPWPPFPAPRFC